MPHHRPSHAELTQLDQAFITYLKKNDANAAHLLNEYRVNAKAWTGLQISECILQIAPYLEAYLADYFAIEPQVAAAQAATSANDPIFAFKKYYVLREAKGQYVIYQHQKC